MEPSQELKQALYEEYVKLHTEIKVMEKMLKEKKQRVENILPLINVKLVTNKIISRAEILEL